MRKAVSVTSLTIALATVLPGVAHAEESSFRSPAPSVEQTAPEVEVKSVGSTKRMTKIVSKSTGLPTVEKESNEKVSGSRLIITKDHTGTQTKLSDGAAISSAGSTPEEIRKRLKSERETLARQGGDEVSLMLEQTSQQKAEAARKKLEEKRQKEAERKARAEADRAEALKILASGGSVGLNDDGSLDTDSFNLQMGSDIPGNNTSRTADGSTVRDAGMNARGKRIAEEALNHLGASYVWGGESPTAGWDCSGFVQWLYAREGVAVPRVAIDQARAAVKVDRPMAGDLVLQNNGSHIGIYLGAGKMVSAWSPDVGTIVHRVDVLPYEFYRVPGAGETIPAEDLAPATKKKPSTAVAAPEPTAVRTPPGAAPKSKAVKPKPAAPKVSRPSPVKQKPAVTKPAPKKPVVKAPAPKPTKTPVATPTVVEPDPVKSATPTPRASAAVSAPGIEGAKKPSEATPSPSATSYEIIDGGPSH